MQSQLMIRNISESKTTPKHEVPLLKTTENSRNCLDVFGNLSVCDSDGYIDPDTMIYDIDTAKKIIYVFYKMYHKMYKGREGGLTIADARYMLSVTGLELKDFYAQWYYENSEHTIIKIIIVSPWIMFDLSAKSLPVPEFNSVKDVDNTFDFSRAITKEDLKKHMRLYNNQFGHMQYFITPRIILPFTYSYEEYRIYKEDTRLLPRMSPILSTSVSILK